jgi:hypothetical protein
VREHTAQADEIRIPSHNPPAFWSIEIVRAVRGPTIWTTSPSSRAELANRNDRSITGKISRFLHASPDREWLHRVDSGLGPCGGSALFGFAHIALDYQFINNPAYNRDRSPVSIFGLQLHLQY